MNSYEILYALKEHEKIRANERDPYWWKGSGSFEVVVGALLTQQSRWEKVEMSLQNLKDNSKLSLEKLSSIDLLSLENMIKPSGLYRQKAKNIQNLCKNILEEFGDFESFSQDVSREWLLFQKGIGFESADAILNYACMRETFVVDNYTNVLLRHYGYEFESYSELKEWMEDGILQNLKSVYELYSDGTSLAQIYARFHGKIVMFCKENVVKKRLKRGVKGL